MSVSDPVKQGEGVHAYISYRVTTKTNLSQYKYNQCSVIRRYSDFEWLSGRLAEKNVGIIIPPIPEKSAVEKFRFSPGFIEDRRRSLHEFINRVAKHPALRMSTDLQLFLEASEEVWLTETKYAMAMTKKKSHSPMQLIRGWQESAKAFISGRKDEELEPEEYLKLKQYMNELEGHLGELHRQSARVLKKQLSHAKALNDVGTGMILLGECESGELTESFRRAGDKAAEISKASQKLVTELHANFEQPLKGLLQSVDSVKAVMNDRSDALARISHLESSINAKKLRLGKLRADPLKSDRVPQCQRELEDLTQLLSEANEQYQLIVERMRSEIARWQKEKSTDLQHLLREFASSNAKLAKYSASVWESLSMGTQSHEI